MLFVLVTMDVENARSKGIICKAGNGLGIVEEKVHVVPPPV